MIVSAPEVGQTPRRNAKEALTALWTRLRGAMSRPVHEAPPFPLTPDEWEEIEKAEAIRSAGREP